MEDSETYNPSLKISIEDIIKCFSKKSEEKRLKEIKAAVVAAYSGDNTLFSSAQSEIEAQVEDIVKKDKKLGASSRLTYSKGKYKQRKSMQNPGGADAVLQDKTFSGSGGELAVMSELLFNLYNVNRMMVDGGVDVVAYKNGTYFFVQVKTTTVKEGRIEAQISIDNFQKNSAASYTPQMRYIIVARYIDNKGQSKNHFFMFTHQELDKLIFNKTVNRGEKYISIKIRFNDLNGEPILYNGNQEEKAGWYFNNFNL